MSVDCAYYNTFYNAKKFYKAASNERKKRLRTQMVELSPEEKEQLKRQGISTASEGSQPSATEMQAYQNAIEKASRLLEFHPNSKYVDDALMLLGQSFYYRRDYSKAQRKFEEIIQLYPDSKFIPEARLLMAKTQLGLQNFSEAESQFREIALDSKLKGSIREEAAYELAGLYFEKENYELAAQEYRQVAQTLNDKSMRAMSLYRLGECLVAQKSYKEATKILKRAVNESPNEDFKSQATFKLGQAQSLGREYELAVRTFSDLLSKEFEAKRIPMIKLELANNLRAKGDLNAAVKRYENIIEEHKKTDASARSYFSLGDIEENISDDFKKAKEDYDLVRGEFPNSAIAPEARRRSDNIATWLDLKNAIAELEGRATTADSLNGKTNGKDGEQNREEEKDDAPIDLSSDAMWMNYAGRDRPPPASLQNLSSVDMQRAAASQERQLNAAVVGDSVALAKHALVTAPADSATLAREDEKKKEQKRLQLVQKNLSLAELWLLNFNKPDSAIEYYVKVIEAGADSSLSARALFSLGYIFRSLKADTSMADSIFNMLLTIYPQTPQTVGVRHILGLPAINDKVDSAKILFLQAEKAYWKSKNSQRALTLYKKASKLRPDSPYSRKADYAIGWLYENAFHDHDKAITQYRRIVEDAPESFYAKAINPKLAAFEKAKLAEENRLKAIADSLANLTEAASQAAGASDDSLQTAATADSAGSKEEMVVRALADSAGTSTSLETTGGVGTAGNGKAGSSAVDSGKVSNGSLKDQKGGRATPQIDMQKERTPDKNSQKSPPDSP